jgi:hypothetical protein
MSPAEQQIFPVLVGGILRASVSGTCLDIRATSRVSDPVTLFPIEHSVPSAWPSSESIDH